MWVEYDNCVCGLHMSVYVGRILKSVYTVCMWVPYYKSVHVCSCYKSVHTRVCMYVPCTRISKECVYICGFHFVNTSIHVCLVYTQYNTLQHTLQHTATYPYVCLISHCNIPICVSNTHIYFREHIHICVCHLYTMQYTATHTATHCNTPIYVGLISATHPYMWVPFIHTLNVRIYTHSLYTHSLYTLQHTATHTATHCNTPIYVGLIYTHTPFVRTATHCNTHYNTLQCTHICGSHLCTLFKF